MKALGLEGLSAGRRLRLRRIRLALTQNALGEMTGLAHSLVSDAERDTPAKNRPAGQLESASAKMDAALRRLEHRWRTSDTGLP